MAPRKPPKKTLRATFFADLGPTLRGWSEPAAFGVGHDGAIYVVARRPSAESLTIDEGLGIFPKSQVSTPVDHLVVCADGRDLRTMIVPALSLVVSHVQPCLDGVLLVGARCHWRPEGAEKNALLVSWDGVVQRTFTFGDGIEDVHTTADGTSWVSYFDEGVFGNFGWSNPGPEAIGASGLVAFDSSGAVRFAYDAVAAGTDAICDAYATNVAEDGTVWVHFYTEFPIVRIHQGAYRRWKLGVGGARALAARGDRVLLFGDYEQRCLGRVVSLDGDTATVVEEVSILGASGEALDRAWARGVGERLFFFEGGRAMVVSAW
jgi:hypothetical protein